MFSKLRDWTLAHRVVTFSMVNALALFLFSCLALGMIGGGDAPAYAQSEPRAHTTRPPTVAPAERTPQARAAPARRERLGRNGRRVVRQRR